MDPSTLESERGAAEQAAAAEAPELTQPVALLNGDCDGALAAAAAEPAEATAAADPHSLAAAAAPLPEAEFHADAVLEASDADDPETGGASDGSTGAADVAVDAPTGHTDAETLAAELSPPASRGGLAAGAPSPGFSSESGPAADLSPRDEASPAEGEGAGDGGGSEPPAPLSPDDEFPGEVEMPLVDHLEELRRRVLRSLLAVVVAAAGCLLFVRPLVKLLEAPAQGIRFLQLAPGEFLFVSLKVAGYAGLTLAIPWILFEGLAFVLPGLTRKERRLVAPTVAGSTVLFAAGLAFAWWALVPAALRFLVSYGADVVEPIWSIERYLDFVLLLMVATALAFQLPVLQLLLGALGLVDARRMLGAWRWVVLVSALAGAVLTPSTDPVTMLLLSGAITALYLIGVGLVALVSRPKQRFGQA